MANHQINHSPIQVPPTGAYPTFQLGPSPRQQHIPDIDQNPGQIERKKPQPRTCWQNKKEVNIHVKYISIEQSMFTLGVQNNSTLCL